MAGGNQTLMRVDLELHGRPLGNGGGQAHGDRERGREIEDERLRALLREGLAAATRQNRSASSRPAVPPDASARATNNRPGAPARGRGNGTTTAHPTASVNPQASARRGGTGSRGATARRAGATGRYR
jgi:hypothetical protein